MLHIYTDIIISSNYHKINEFHLIQNYILKLFEKENIDLKYRFIDCEEIETKILSNDQKQKILKEYKTFLYLDFDDKHFLLFDEWEKYTFVLFNIETNEILFEIEYKVYCSLFFFYHLIKCIDLQNLEETKLKINETIKLFQSCSN